MRWTTLTPILACEVGPARISPVICEEKGDSLHLGPLPTSAVGSSPVATLPSIGLVSSDDLALRSCPARPPLQSECDAKTLDWDFSATRQGWPARPYSGPSSSPSPGRRAPKKAFDHATSQSLALSSLPAREADSNG
ncbi:hypothetical protein CALVIDRAFT_536410 [Calocera viscosa TUFC12733]|uniref:Uncharacterized protein n=1 Tax=Calocera viscosa (strain TUFC12733) TaxID=1330018 RepID=A0A167N6Q7_CALVF|nr:hypothetical protein CALVIDRAFT_536410 [Calocera viscosa TUFC12733]